MEKKTVVLLKQKETKYQIVFGESEKTLAPVIKGLYLPKAFVGDETTLKVTIEGVE